AMLQTIVGSTTTNHYLFHDQLGSLVRLTNAAGTAINSQDHAAFGARRSYTDPSQVGTAPTLTTRGFTGHEMIDGVLGMIHMNGRIFDPRLGRFLQADPFIQAPANTQSWNAYTYVFNNPYRYTDPSGNLGLEERQWIGAVVMIAALVIGQPYIGTATYVGIMATAGFLAGAITTQSWRGGLLGAMTGTLTGGMASGLVGAGGFAAWGLSTAAGGVMGSIQGGGFGHSFLSAGLTAGLMPHVGHIGNTAGRTVVGALVGGTISRVTGGKFANGAVSGAVSAAMSGGGSRREESTLTAEQQASFTEQSAYNPETALAFESPSLPQGLVDGVAGFGDALSFGGSRYIRSQVGIGSVDYSSGSYTAGEVAGVAYGTAIGGVGGLSGGARSVFWSGSGNMERAAAMGRSLERTPIGSVMNRFGNRLPDWSWRAASSIYARNASGTAIKVGLQQGRIWSTVELPILVQRAIPVITIP
nr:RHS repeat-associated core domain-containing protein [Pseudomonadota bacterium]